MMALVPLARLVSDWIEVTQVMGITSVDRTARGFDWSVWDDNDGLITVQYAFEQNGDAPALQEGDVFFQLDFQQYFNVEDLKRAIDGIPPGSERTYSVLRNDRMVEIPVLFTRYPTFLYPLSEPLWNFAIWGFLLGAFFHLLGLIIAAPLATRSRPARFSLLLVAVSSLWLFGNLLRLLMIEFIGPCPPGSFEDRVFQGLTLVGMVGWIGFPALLLHKVVDDARYTNPARIGLSRFLLYIPPVILALAALLTTFGGSLGPVTLDSLAAPILFYACCYIGVAAALVLALHLVHPETGDEQITRLSKTGSALMLAVALLFGLSVLGIVPIFGIVNDTTAGWLIVGAQLLSVVPVVLVAHASLKHGKIDQVVNRALAYLTILGLIFFLFVGGMTLLDPYLDRLNISRVVAEGLYVLALLFLFERFARMLRRPVASFFATDRQRARQVLARFQEHMPSLLDYESLGNETMQVVGTALQSRSGRFFMRPQGISGPWLSSAYHPEPPFLTERVVLQVWPHLQREGAIWARNPELNESTLPADLARLLTERKAVLAIPVMGDGTALGLLVLGEKKQKRAVYNLEDLDLLRSLCGQLALAIERLNLVERERELVRESAEAQLKALRAQINPHFLFNALNTIVSLIEEHPEDAEAVVEHLAAIFRHILHTGERAFVTVQEEFALVSHYLSIEQARFGDRLTVHQKIDPGLHGVLVPAFAVQTLVENAVKHGLEKRRNGGTLTLTCHPGPSPLNEVEVTDTGIGIAALFEQGEQVISTEAAFFGIGLRNVAARLERLYGRTDLLRMRSDPVTGTTVRLLLPPESPSDAAPGSLALPATPPPSLNVSSLD